MKKLIALLLAALLVFSFSACSVQGEGETDSKDDKKTEEEEKKEESEKEPEEEPSPETEEYVYASYSYLAEPFGGVYSEDTIVSDGETIYSVKQHVEINTANAGFIDYEKLFELYNEEYAEDNEFITFEGSIEENHVYMDMTYVDLDNEDNVEVLKEHELFFFDDDNEDDMDFTLENIEEYLFDEDYVPKDEFEMPEEHYNSEPVYVGNDVITITPEIDGGIYTYNIYHEDDAITGFEMICELPLSDDMKYALEVLGKDAFIDMIKESMSDDGSIASPFPGYDDYELIIDCTDEALIMKIVYDDLDDPDNVNAFFTAVAEGSDDSEIPYQSCIKYMPVFMLTAAFDHEESDN